MAMYPNVQAKVQQEIDDVVGKRPYFEKWFDLCEAIFHIVSSLHGRDFVLLNWKHVQDAQW